MIEGNPFMDLAPKPEEPKKKGFTGTMSPVVTAAVATLPACGDPTCKRSHRKNGDHYSDDKEQRFLELREDGKVGPQFGALGGQRPKNKRRALEVVAEAAAENAEKIRQVYLDGIDENQPISVRLAAADKFLSIEEKEIAREVAQRQAEFDNMNKDQLVSSIQEMLGKMSQAGEIATEVEAMVEADVVD